MINIQYNYNEITKEQTYEIFESKLAFIQKIGIRCCQEVVTKMLSFHQSHHSQR